MIQLRIENLNHYNLNKGADDMKEQFATDLTKEDLQLIYLLLHKVSIPYLLTAGMEYDVHDLIEKVGKEIVSRILNGE